MIRNYNEFNIEVIPDSFNLKEHNGYENAIFLTSKGTKTNKKNKMERKQSYLSMDSVHCNGNETRTDNERINGTTGNTNTTMDSLKNKHHMGDNKNENNNERTRLITQNVLNRYDKEQVNRCDSGRPNSGRCISLPGINLYHPPPRATNWQSKRWLHGASTDIDRIYDNSNIIDNYDNSRYKIHNDHLKKQFQQIKANAKGKWQGDGIKRPSNPLPPTVIKAKPKVIVEVPKIEWQARDTEFDDIMEEDDIWNHCQWNDSDKKETSWTDFLKSEVKIVIPQSVINQNRRVQARIMEEKNKARILRKEIRETRNRIKDEERKRLNAVKSQEVQMGIAQMMTVEPENTNDEAVSQMMQNSPKKVSEEVPKEVLKQRPVVLKDSGNEKRCYYRHIVSCEELGIGNLFSYMSKEITGDASHPWINAVWIKNGSFTSSTLTPDELAIARRSLGRTRLDVLQDFENGDFRIVTNDECETYPPIVLESETWYGKVIRNYNTVREELTATVAKVRETATTIGSSFNGLTTVKEKATNYKFIADAIVDFRTIQLDIEHFFCNEDIGLADKFGRLYFYLNYIGNSYGDSIKKMILNTGTFQNVSQSYAESMCGFVKDFFNFLGLNDFCFKVFRDYITLDSFYVKIKSFFPNIFKLIRYIVDWVSMAFDTPKFLEWYDNATGLGLENLVHQVNNVMHLPLLEALDMHTNGELDKLYNKMEQLVNVAGIGGWKNALFLKKKAEEFAKFQQKLVKMEQEAFGRITPFCICLVGQSQIGKSQLLTAIADKLIPKTVEADKRIYSRGQTEHYDGYTGQYCIMVDDWAARVQTDYSELLQWVTCQTMVLPMASVDSKDIGVKGTTCQAKLILLATNTGYPTMTTTMNNGEAVLKRRHAMVHVTKITEDYSDKFEHLSFRLHHPVSGNPLMEYGDMTFVELITLLKDKNAIHLAKEEKLLAARKRSALGLAQMKWDQTLKTATYFASGMNSSEGASDLVFNTISGNSSFMTSLQKACQLGLNGAKQVVLLSSAISLAEQFWDHKTNLKTPALLAGVGVMLQIAENYVAGRPRVKEYDIRNALRKLKMDPEEIEWIYAMHMKRQELKNGLARYRAGQPGINKDKIDRSLRALNMLQYWEDLEALNFEKEEVALSESDMRTKDGIRRKRQFVAEAEGCDTTVMSVTNGSETMYIQREGDMRSERDKEDWKFKYPKRDIVFDCRRAAVLYYCRYEESVESMWKRIKKNIFNRAEQQERMIDYITATKDRTRLYEILDHLNGREVVRNGEAEMETYKEGKLSFNLPKPTDNQTFSPPSLALSYIAYYAQFLETRNPELVETKRMSEWCAKWVEASNRYNNLYQIIDYVNGVGEAEASVDRSSDDVSKMALDAMVRFTKVKNGEIVGALNALCVRGTTFLLPYHFFLKSGGSQDSNFDIEVSKGFEYSGNRYGTSSKLLIPFDSANLFVSSHTLDRRDDWCLYTVGNSWQSGKDLIGHLIKEKDLELLTEFDALLVIRTPTRVIHHVRGRSRSIANYKVSDSDSKSFNLVRAWNYKANTENGDCGAPLLVRNAQIPRKILGIHVSAIRGTDEGFASVITYEKVIELMPGLAQWCTIPDLSLEKLNKHITLDNFEYVGSVRKEHQVVVPNATKIRESLVAPLFEKKKFPSVLDFNDPRYEGEEDILEKQQDKYTGLRTEFPQKLMDEIVQDIVDQHSFDPLYPRKVLSEHEMLNGFDNLPRVDPHSSAGYPYGATWYKKEHGLVDMPGKQTYLQLEDAWTFRGNHMRKVVENREETAKKGLRVPSLWTATLKDETLGMNKIANGNTRLFQSPPMDFTLLLRKYTGAFSSFVFRNNMRLGTAAGFNPESGAWSNLAYELLDINNTVGALDYTWFDGSLSAQLMFGALRIINEWYNGSEEESMVRFILFHEIVFTHILVRRDVYLKFKGNPSGNALTMVMNNLISKILLRYYWMTLAPVNKKDCKIWSYTTKEFVMGDDNIFAVPNEYLEFLTGQKIIAEAKKIGLTATSEKKDHTSVFKPLDDTTFMQRGFRFDNLEVKPLLNLKSIENMMIWISNSKFMSALECTQVNVECALRYLYFWGPYVYNHYLEILRKYSNQEQLNLPLYSYEYYDRLYNELGELPNEYSN